MPDEIAELEQALADALAEGDRELVRQVRHELAVARGQQYTHIKTPDEVLAERERTFSYGGGQSSEDDS